MTPQRLDLFWFFMEVSVELHKLHHHPATSSTQGASISSRIQVTGSQGLPTDLRKISKVPRWSVVFLREISRSPNSWLKFWKISYDIIIKHVLWWVVTKQFESLLPKTYIPFSRKDHVFTYQAWMISPLHRLLDRDPYFMAKNINPM